jgi:hypothetical protein
LKINNVFVPTYNSENKRAIFLPQQARKYQSASATSKLQVLWKKKKMQVKLRKQLDLHNAY